MLPLLVSAGATFGDDDRYRYNLWRNFVVDPKDACLWVMLNPSTATETADDPTVRRCQQFSRAWGFDACRVVNIFAWRSTDPKVLTLLEDPVGPENDEWIAREASWAGKIICAWGAYGHLRGRSEQMHRLLSPYEPWCFGLTKNMQPLHPLYQHSTTPLVRWN